jgi:hypothetical protein
MSCLLSEAITQPAHEAASCMKLTRAAFSTASAKASRYLFDCWQSCTFLLSFVICAASSYQVLLNMSRLGSPRISVLILPLFILALTTPISASPVPSYFTQWLDSTVFPQRGGSISDEIKCYGLPYGAIGNLSHVLTYWTLGCLFFYRTPWWPWRALRAGQIDLFLGIVQLLVSVGVASLTIARCRNRWQFIVLAAARLQFSLTLGYCAIHTSTRIMRGRQGYEGIPSKEYLPLPQRKLVALPWLVHLSALPGLAALGSLIRELWQACECESKDACTVCNNWRLNDPLPIRNISYAFLSTIALMLIVLAFMVGRSRGHQTPEKARSISGACHIVGGVISLLLALYTDWLLATIADNLVGSPSGDLAILYWVS